MLNKTNNSVCSSGIVAVVVAVVVTASFTAASTELHYNRLN